MYSGCIWCLSSLVRPSLFLYLLGWILHLEASNLHPIWAIVLLGLSQSRACQLDQPWPHRHCQPHIQACWCWWLVVRMWASMIELWELLTIKIWKRNIFLFSPFFELKALIDIRDVRSVSLGDDPRKVLVTSVLYLKRISHKRDPL